MDILKIKPQSIILYIGPTNSGKSYFTTEFLIPKLREEFKDMNKPVNIQHISSDNIRRELLGFNPFTDKNYIHKNDDRMSYVSAKAFSLLSEKLIAVTSFPMNADFVIIDTTGLAKEFRDEMEEIAKKVNYTFCPIVFDYRNREDYFKYATNNDSFGKKIISNSLKKFKEKQAEYTKKIYPNLQKIKTINFSEIQIEIENKEWYKSFFLSEKDEYTIIGDVHQSYQELKNLLIKNGFTIDENDLIID